MVVQVEAAQRGGWEPVSWLHFCSVLLQLVPRCDPHLLDSGSDRISSEPLVCSRCVTAEAAGVCPRVLPGTGGVSVSVYQEQH